MLMSQKQTVGSSGEQASVSGAAGSECPQAEELHGYKAVVRELKGKSGDGQVARQCSETLSPSRIFNPV